MKGKRIVFSAWLRGLISLLMIIRVFAQLPAGDLTQCQQTQLVRDFYDPKSYIVACIECFSEYVLSFDLQTCTHYSQLEDNSFQFCKRFGRKGICIEALCAIQLNEEGGYISKLKGNDDENCAQFDSSSGDCILPRLLYVLDQDSKSISKDTDTFCALKKNGQCNTYHSSFLPQASFSVLISNFQNSEDLDTQTYIDDGELKCSNGCELSLNDSTTSGQKYFGCVLINYLIQDCLQYNQLSRFCIQCKQGYSLNISGRQCIQLNHCIAHKTIYQQNICLKCEPWYFYQNQQCKPLKNCAVQDKQSFCNFCNSPYYGSLCQAFNKDVSDSCELLNYDGHCTKCKNNDDYFLNIYTHECQSRQLSKNCIIKSYINDQCDSFDCEKGYYFDVSHFNIIYGDFISNSNYSCDQIQKENIYNDNIYWWRLWSPVIQWYTNSFPTIHDIYYQKYYLVKGQFQLKPFCVKQDSIDNCLQYDKCYQSCKTCAQGYSLQQRTDLYTDYYYRFICAKDPQLSNNISNCIVFDKWQLRCLKCQDFYSNYYDSCKIGSISQCRTYGDKNNCQQCNKNYALFNNQCFYVELCSEYQWNGYNAYCTKCFEKPDIFISLVQSSNGLRQDCVQNQGNDACSFYIDNVCARCSKGYVLIDNTNRCVSEQDVIDFCLQANEKLECYACVSGYRLVDGKCFRINGSCTIRYTCDSAQCKIDCAGIQYNYNYLCSYQCPQQYGLRYQSCNKCDSLYGEGCDKCNHNQICQICKPGYFWDQSQERCRYNCPNGQIVNQKAQCNNCTVKNCKSCSQSDICDICYYSFFILDNFCLDKCPDGYNSYISSLGYGQFCYKCDDKCETCYFKDSNSTYCSQCKPGLFNQNGSCVDKCQYFTNNGNCTDQCDGYLLDQHTCVNECPSFYITKFNYLQNYNTYKVCIDSCPYFTYLDKDQKLCFENCDGGYYPNKTSMICQKCQVQNCSSCFNGLDVCDKCYYPFSKVNNQCWFICSNQKIVPDSSYCNNCNIIGCENNCELAGQCTSCQENYILQNSSYCYCPIEQGFYIDYPAQCKKCNIDYCLKCQSSQQCTSCQNGYYLLQNQTQPTDQVINQVNQCVKQCPQGYFSQNGWCNQCNQNCLKCASGDTCSLCQDGYVPITITFTNAAVIGQNKYVQCYFRCPDGSKQTQPPLCACQDVNCSQCTDPYKCEVCKIGYKFNTNGICVQDIQQNCTLPNCKTCVLSLTPALCQVCLDGWKSVSGICKYQCPNNGEVVDSPNNCYDSTLCIIKNCSICEADYPQICQSCVTQYYLQDGACFNTCIDGYYAAQINNQQVCQQCNFQCKTCTNDKECTSCKANITLDNQCMCPAGQKLYKNLCVKKCPFYSTLIGDNICIEHCVNGLYPYYTMNKEQRLCEDVLSDNSNFCIQNIENIPDIFSVSLDNASKDATKYMLNIRLEQTPSICYQLAFKSKGDNSFPINLASEDYEGSIYQVVIPKDSIKNGTLDCTDFQCTASIEIYFAEVKQYIVFINIHFDIDIILTNGVSYTGTYATFNAVCPTCIIPSTLVIKSSLTFVCPATQVCSSQGIQTTTNTQISVTQHIDDIRFLNNKLQPHSLRLVYVNAKNEETTIFINNYFYDNTILGQISYTFITIALKPGNLIITSVCNSAKSSQSGRLLATASDSGVYYPQMKIPFVLTDVSGQSNTPDNSQHNNTITQTQNVENTTAILISSIIGGIILLLIIVVILYKLHKKNQNQKKLYLKASSTISKVNEIGATQPKNTIEVEIDNEKNNINLIV